MTRGKIRDDGLRAEVGKLLERYTEKDRLDFEKVLARMTGEQVDVLSRVSKNQSIAEIAKSLAMPRKATKARIDKARKIVIPLMRIEDFAPLMRCRELIHFYDEESLEAFYDRIVPEGGTSANYASSWTGKATPTEIQQTVVRTIPIVAGGFNALVQAIEDKRLNDPDAQAALEAARDLHHALGELLRMAEAGKGLDGLVEKWAALRERGLRLLNDKRVFYAASPVLTVGTVAALEFASGENMGSTEHATVWAGLMATRIFGEKTSGA